MGIFAYFDSGHEFPEEIVMAAGFTPMKILGDLALGTSPADEYLFPYFCPFARARFAEALSKAGEWIGIGFAHGCDATNRHFDVWRYHIKEVPFFWVNTPMKTDNAARSYYRRELEQFLNKLCDHYSLKIVESDIQHAIELSNQTKTLLRQLSILRRQKDIPNRDYFKIIQWAMVKPKEAAVNDLKKTIEDWEKRPPFPTDKIPILLTGSEITFVEFMDLLDDVGFRVVRDDLSLGERYFATDIPYMEDPLEALVIYSCNIPQPATRVPSDNRLNYLINALEETQIMAVISQHLKFCEVYAMDAVWTVPAIKKRGLPVIHLERDYTPMDDRLLTRLEAFREIII